MRLLGPVNKFYLSCSRANSWPIKSLWMLQNDLPTSFQKRRLYSYCCRSVVKTSCSPIARWQNIDHMSRVFRNLLKYNICHPQSYSISITHIRQNRLYWKFIEIQWGRYQRLNRTIVISITIDKRQYVVRQCRLNPLS